MASSDKGTVHVFAIRTGKARGSELCVFIHVSVHMGVSKNGGILPPKWMVKIMEHPIKMDDLGVPLFLETPIYSFCCFLRCTILPCGFEGILALPKLPKYVRSWLAQHAYDRLQLYYNYNILIKQEENHLLI